MGPDWRVLARQGTGRTIGVIVVIALAVLALQAAPAAATTLPPGFSEQTLATGFSAPVAVETASDGRRFVAEKAGRVRVVNPDGTLRSAPLIDLRSKVNTFSDRGLLGMALDTNFDSNGYLYLLYVHELNPQTPDTSAPMVSRLTRVTVKSDSTLENPSSPETVILGKDASGPCPTPDNTRDCIPADYIWHTIGTVRSDPTDGTLWVGTGDTHPHAIDSSSYRPYDTETFAGKIMHIDRQGRGLPNHPFCQSDTNLDHTCTKIYARGFRNPFRFTLRPGKGPVVGDVGAGDEEEIDLIKPGENYGWPCYEGSVKTPLYDQEARCQQEYAKEGGPDAATPPSWSYSQADGGAVVAGPVYTGNEYPEEYRGDIFVGDYVQGWVKRLEVDAQDNVTQVHDFASDWAPGVDLEQLPNGRIGYVDIGFGATPSAVREFRFSGGNSPPTATASATPTAGDPPLAVQFTGGGSSDPDGDSLSYDWDFGDGSAGSPQANPSHTYTQSGTYDAALTVDDGKGNTDTATVRINVGGNAAPEASVDAPADESSYRGGEQVQLRGSATDREDGQIGTGGLSWQVLLHHNTHVHEVGTFTGGTASFAPLQDHDLDSYYEIRLTATDGAGATDTETIEIRPEASELTLDSSPPGAQLSYGDTTASAPFKEDAAVGFRTTVSAPETTTYHGRTYRFDRWSDGGARQHDVTVPAADTTLRADYEPEGDVETLRFKPDADTYVDASAPTSPKGSSDGLTVDEDPERESFLSFPVSGIGSGDVIGARLRMRQTDLSSEGGVVHPISPSSWSEATTWNNRPAINGPQLAGFGRVANGFWYEADLGQGAVPGDGPASYAIDTPVGDKSRWSSSESTAEPELIVEVDRSGGGEEGPLSQVAGPSGGSVNPTSFGGNHRLAPTSGGRLLAVHGRNRSGVQLAWKDPGESWQTRTTGDASGGVLSTGTGSLDLVASIATARDQNGNEHAWVVWSAPQSSNSNPQPVRMRRLTELDSPNGPKVGPAVAVDSPPNGAFKADVAFERAPGGEMRGAIVYSRRPTSSRFEIATTWFTNLTSDTPGFQDRTAIASQTSSNNYFGTLVPTGDGMRVVTRGSSTSGSMRVFAHKASDPLSNWTRSSASGSSISSGAAPSAAALPSSDTLVAAETDTGSRTVKVKRFSASGASVTNELTLTGYDDPSIATDGDRAWLVMVRASDGRVVSRERTSAGAWSGSDRVEVDASGGGNHAWPNLVRDADGRVRFVVRGPSGGTRSSAVLAYDRALGN